MKFIFTLLLTSLFGVIQAQQNYYEEWYSAESENIPQNSIKSIVPDKYGFIWMTTENGLLRFDGKNFKIFNSGNSDLLSNRFTYITGSIKKDSLHTQTAYNEDFTLIRKRGIEKIKKNQNTINPSTKFEQILYYNNNQNNSRIDYRKSGITCENGDYYYIDDEKITLYNKDKIVLKEVKQVYKENTIYFLIENELTLLNFKENTYSSFKNDFAITYTLVLPKNCKIIYNHTVQQLFIYSKNEISLVNKTINQLYLTPVFTKNNININIKSLYFDKDNSKLFIGSLDKGLNVVSLNQFKTLLNPTTNSNNYYGSFPISANEFITSKGEIFNINGLVSDLKIEITDLNYSITIDKEQNIWIPNVNKLVKYYKSSNYKNKKTYLLKEPIRTVYCDSRNKIWIGMDRLVEKNAKVYTIDANDEDALPISLKKIQKSVNFFLENKKSEILIVTENELLIYNPKNEALTTVPSGKNEIRSLFIAKDNSIWACTYNNGFSLFENNTFYKMPYDHKMYLLSSHCIKEDNAGYFWISTNKGLIEVSKKSLFNYHKNKTPVYYNHYNIKNGFLTNEFNGGCQPCAIELNDDFIFPSLNGMVLFNPEKTRKKTSNNDFYINEVELDGKINKFKDTIFVNRSINRIKFKIDYAYFGNLDNVFFEVKLELTKKEKWINLSNENEIIFTNLPPGNHSLLVRKIKPFSSEYETKKIVISIPFLFYEKIWFKVLISILLISIFLFALKIRNRLIRKKNIALEKTIKQRTSDLFETVSSLKITKNNLNQEILQQKKLIGTISHDIRSPLRFLSITAKYLYEKSLLSENESIKDNAKVMQESASELYRFVENLVDYSKVFMENNDVNKSKKENIDTIISEKIDLFNNMAKGVNVAITYKNNVSYPIDLNKRILGIIIHNLMDNAIKNTKNGKINIETNVIKNKIYISVQDTGVGISEEIRIYYINLQKNYETDKLALQNYGLGLHIVLELLRLLKGDIKIDSEEGEGTKVSIIIDKI